MTRHKLSQRVANLPPSGIREFFDILAEMPEVISLGIGEPDFVTPAPITQAGVEALAQGQTQYTSNSGTMELRQALAAHLKRLYDVDYNPVNELVITVGVSEALYLALTALIDPGDEIIIPTPCFVAYQAEVALAGGVPVEIPSKMENNFMPDPDEIVAAVTPKTKAILIGYPNNPTGAVASAEVLQAIGRIAEQHDLVIISDEIYDQLVYGVGHVCVPALEGLWPRTVLLGGFSKDYAMTGWRVGYAAGPADILQGMLRVHQYTIMSAPTMSQAAALAALQVGIEYVDEMREEYDRRRKLIVSGLNQIGLPTFEPFGAFYAFPQIAGTGLDSMTFSKRLLQEKQVAVIPGSAFGAGGEGYVRCAYAAAYDDIQTAIERMGEFVSELG